MPPDQSVGEVTGHHARDLGETMIIVGIVYVLGVGAFGWSYIENGVFLAFDERPWWLATLHVVFWPAFLAADLLRAIGVHRADEQTGARR